MEKRKIYGKDLTISFQKLSKDNCHMLSKINCNKKYIQKYFREEALNDNKATTYIFINELDSDVISAFSISCSGIVDTSNPRYRDIIPAIEIDNFATNENYQKMPYSEDWDDGTLSHQLLLFCINYIKQVPCSYCSAVALILHSVPDAIKFYENGGFQSFLEYMSEKNTTYLKGCTPMFLNLI